VGFVHPLTPAVAIDSGGAQIDQPAGLAASLQRLQEMAQADLFGAPGLWRHQVVELCSLGGQRRFHRTVQVAAYRVDATGLQLRGTGLAAHQGGDGGQAECPGQALSHVTASNDQGFTVPH